MFGRESLAANAFHGLRRVIDVSGDGTPNAGRDVRPVVAAAERQGVTINGIAIEGLGLAITRRIVEEAEGTIEVAQRPSGGSSFTLRLRAG